MAQTELFVYRLSEITSIFPNLTAFRRRPGLDARVCAVRTRTDAAGRRLRRNEAHARTHSVESIFGLPRARLFNRIVTQFRKRDRLPAFGPKSNVAFDKLPDDQLFSA